MEAELKKGLEEIEEIKVQVFGGLQHAIDFGALDPAQQGGRMEVLRSCGIKRNGEISLFNKGEFLRL